MSETRRELEFVGELGRGGFGAVYLARLRGADRFARPVAVKVMRAGPAPDPNLVARQRDEARLLGMITHHAVVQVLELTTIGGWPAVVMEYVDGIDAGKLLDALRAQGRTFPRRAALELIASTASALDAVYFTRSPDTGAPLRAIHRDVKPSNLLVTARGGVKVLDFGIARADFAREGVTGSAFYGTANYMGPEFWAGEAIGPGYDVYALGATLLELLSGAAPTRAVPHPGRHGEWVDGRLAELVAPPPELASLLRGMLSYRPADRPSAAEVEERAHLLAGRLDDEPLARLARVVVPPLLEARDRAIAELPAPVVLDGPLVDVTPPTPQPGAGGRLPTPPGGPVTPPFDRRDPSGPTEPARSGPERAAETVAADLSPRRPGGGGAWAGAIGVGLLALVLLAGAGWAAWQVRGTPAEALDPGVADALDPGVADALDPGAAGAADPAGGPVEAALTATDPALDAVTSGALPGASAAGLPGGATGAPAGPGPASSSPTGGSPAAATSAAGARGTTPAGAAPSSAAPSSAATAGAPSTGPSSTGTAPGTPTHTATSSSAPGARTSPGARSAAVPTSTPASTPAPTAAASEPASAGAPAATTHPFWFTSDPLGATVRVDGRAVGVTPLSGLRLTEGGHQVEIVIGEQVGRRSVEVGPGRPNSWSYQFSSGAWRSSVR